MSGRPRRSAERLGTGLGLLLAVAGALAVYQLAELVAPSWNPFASDSISAATGGQDA